MIFGIVKSPFSKLSPKFPTRAHKAAPDVLEKNELPNFPGLTTNALSEEENYQTDAETNARMSWNDSLRAYPVRLVLNYNPGPK
jgi:hypothetical protein